MQTHEELQAVLNTLAANFGTSIESLWTILIRQVYIDAVTDFFPTILFLIVARVLWQWHQRHNARYESLKEERPYYSHSSIHEGVIALWIAVRVAILAALIAFLVGFYSAIVAIFNPEWAALQMIFGKLPGA